MKKRFFAMFCIILALGVIIGTGTAFADVQSDIEGAANDSTLVIPAGTYTFSDITVWQTNLTIQGAGAGSTIIQAGLIPYQGAGRVFIINEGASVTIEGITIQNGKAPDGYGYNTDGSGKDGVDGGGILNNGTLTLRNCTVQGNAAGDGYQGAPGKDGAKDGTQPLEKPKAGTDPITGNGIDGAIGDTGGKGDDGTDGYLGGNGGNGGGIFNSNTASLVLDNCAIKDNKAGNGQLGGSGGMGKTGGTGGKGGDAGNADLTLGGTGGTGGSGGDGGTGGDGGSGGKGGDGGSGGGIYNANIMTGETTCTFSGNTVGVAGDGGIPGDGGAGGNGGNGGYGGWSVAGGAYTTTQPGGQGGTGGNGGNSGGFDGFTGEGKIGADGTPPTGATGGSGGAGGAGGTGGNDGDIGRQPAATEKDYVSVPSITTKDVTSVAETTAVSGGTTITAGGTGLTITAKGVCWSTTANPTADLVTKTDEGTGTTDFTSQISGLVGGKTYYVRAYATNSNGLTGYGIQSPFTTLTKPGVETLGVVNGLVTGRITSEGNTNVTTRGICWSGISETPTTLDSHVFDTTLSGSYTGEFTKQMPPDMMTPGKKYFVSAYAINSVGTSYGYPSKPYTNPDMPTVTTNTTVTGVSANGATVSGNVTSDGGADIMERGICWSKTSSPKTTDNKKAFSPAGTGAFSISITGGLEPFTLYYAAAYAINGAGTAYGYGTTDTTFRTPAGLPEVTTGSASSVTTTTALLSGTLVSNGGDPGTEKGVCWSKVGELCKELPDTVTAGNGISVPVTGLTHETTYTFKAYAKNGVGTTYGEPIEFPTPQAKYPKVTTDTTVIPKTLTSAEFSGKIVKQDNTPINEKGFCWNTTGTPTIASNLSQSDVSTDTTTILFSNIIEVFPTGTTYSTIYIRAYAKNTRGTAYGSQITYSKPDKPTVETKSVTEITTTTAKLTGNIPTPASLISITERGFCWSETEIPDGAAPLAMTHTSSGAGDGEFTGLTSDVTQLVQGATYYVRAYAVTNVGTFLGNQLSFTTLTAPTVEIKDPTDITESKATVEASVTATGGSDVTVRGVFWSDSSIDITTDPKPDPTTYSHIASTDGTGIGIFTSSLTGLTFNTTYYVRAYAINGVGTAYSEEKSFTTSLEKGDVNCDGIVDLQDAIVALKMLSGIEPSGICENSKTADVNGDEKIGIEDVIFILRNVLGL